MNESEPEFFCALCRTHRRGVDAPQYGMLDMLWPVGTPPDAGRHRIDVCNLCLYVKITFLWQERSHPDDVQPMDEQGVGHVAKDDFIGES